MHPIGLTLRNTGKKHPHNPGPEAMLLGGAQVEDGVCVPGLSIKQIASTADVEAVMCSASAQQHSATSHLVLSVYVACKDRTTGKSQWIIILNCSIAMLSKRVLWH